MALKVIQFTGLPFEEEAIIVAFRRNTLLPLDDCVCCLRPTILPLARSVLHRCLKHRGNSRLPEVGSNKPSKQRLKVAVR